MAEQIQYLDGMMRNYVYKITLIGFIVVLFCCYGVSPVVAEPVIIDHTCTDLTQIPDEWIDAAQADIKTYYAHTSHGRQLTIGLEQIEIADAKYQVASGDNTLPSQSGTLCLYDSIGVAPYGYWSSEAGVQATQNILNSHPSINVSIWSWCGEPAVMTAVEMQEYLDAIAQLEANNPNVTFIYMTGHAQFVGIDGYNRYMRNEQIRNWVRQSDNRVLFDFADLDSWWFNPGTGQWEHATYEYANTNVPVEHPQFNDLAGPGHTTYESCEQKGRATWWMMATLAGWNGSGSANQAPVANAGLNKSVGPGEIVELDGSGSYDPDEDHITFYWEQSFGPLVELSGNTLEKPTFVVPESEAGLSFKLTVSDSRGLNDTDSCIVNVITMNQAPVANAGPDLFAYQDERIVLDGSGSYDPDGSIVLYLWEQNSGPEVTLSNYNAVNPTFIAPQISSDESRFTFSLLVKDETDLIMSDEVVVTIEKQDASPDQDMDDNDGGSGGCFILSPVYERDSFLLIPYLVILLIIIYPATRRIH